MKENDLLSQLESVESRTDLSNFVVALLEDFNKNKNEWENSNIPSFLEAMSGWIQDMDGYYKNHDKPFSEDQSWKIFAEILYAAKKYE